MNILQLFPRLLIVLLAPMAATSLQSCEMNPDDTEIEIADLGKTKQGLVDFTYFSGHTREGGVFLSWGTRSESNCAGFNLFRRVSGEVDFTQINETLIAAKSPEGANYEYLDQPLDVGSYDFQLEEVDNQGNLTPYGGFFSVSVFDTGNGNDGGTEDSAQTGEDSVNRGIDCGVVIAPKDKNRSRGLWLLVAMVF